MSEDESVGQTLADMCARGALGVAGWDHDQQPEYLNTAYGIKGFRFDWREATQIALVGMLQQEVNVLGCDHDPSRLTDQPGLVECAKGCGSTWRLFLASAPNPHD